ncbi:MAG: transporter substrate-binding domain-containing protein [Acidaminobacteraceae bacterium]
MKKILILMMMLSLVLTAFVGCAKEVAKEEVELTAESTEATEATETSVEDKLSEIKEKGVLVLGTSADYPPYEFHKEIDGNDTIVGFDIDIAKQIAADMGVELEIIDMKFEGLLPALTAGKIDLIVAGMNPTEERKKSVDFSIVYYDPSQTMLVKSEMVSELNTIESFVGKNIAVQKATLQEETAAEVFPDSNVKSLSKIPNLIMELKTGKVDGLILASPVANSYAKGNDDISVNGLDLGSEGGVSIAIGKDGGELIESINSTLTKLLDSGELDQIITDATLLSESE